VHDEFEAVWTRRWPMALLAVPVRVENSVQGPMGEVPLLAKNRSARRIMNLVGFYEELDPSSKFSQGSIHNVRSDSAQADEDLLVAYLDRGHPLIDFTETTQDVIDGREKIVGGSSLRSDNTWTWKIDLSYYVRKYHLKLPEAFVKHVRSHGFTVPDKDRSLLIERAQEYFARGK
jgi:hypothetical protein